MSAKKRSDDEEGIRWPAWCKYQYNVSSLLCWRKKTNVTRGHALLLARRDGDKWRIETSDVVFLLAKKYLFAGEQTTHALFLLRDVPTYDAL